MIIGNRHRTPCLLHRSLLLALGYTLQPFAVTSAQAQSDTAFVLGRAGVVPENIVFDAPRDRFLGGDLERDGMIELRRDGSIRPFADAAGIDGRVLGLKIDRVRNLLWGVAFTRLPTAPGNTAQPPARSILFALDLPGGKLAAWPEWCASSSAAGPISRVLRRASSWETPSSMLPMRRSDRSFPGSGAARCHPWWY